MSFSVHFMHRDTVDIIPQYSTKATRVHGTYIAQQLLQKPILPATIKQGASAAMAVRITLNQGILAKL